MKVRTVVLKGVYLVFLQIIASFFFLVLMLTFLQLVFCSWWGRGSSVVGCYLGKKNEVMLLTWSTVYWVAHFASMLDFLGVPPLCSHCHDLPCHSCQTLDCCSPVMQKGRPIIQDISKPKMQHRGQTFNSKGSWKQAKHHMEKICLSKQLLCLYLYYI